MTKEKLLTYDELLYQLDLHGYLPSALIKKPLERAKKFEDFILNVFIECDELGLEPTTLTNENGKDIVTRWRKELEALDNV
jgi:hypothetical protein